MWRSFALAAVLIACKSRPASKALDTKNCDAALQKAAAAPLDARAQIVIDGCPVCGDWKPILDWATPEADGGPKRTDIDAAMQRCGYCDANGKQRFLGTLDNARGTTAKTPWRQLGEMCKEQVSAAPDPRFMSAPYYALDRIGRALGAKAAVTLPLPAVTPGGTGPELPTVTVPVGEPPRDVVTVLGDQVFLGTLPRATLGSSGVVLDLGTAPYPGPQVAVAELAARLPKSGVLLIAPRGMPASKLVPVITAAKGVTVHLAAASSASPAGWQLPESIPYPLETGPSGIAVTSEMTVQNLATEIVSKQSGTIVGL